MAQLSFDLEWTEAKGVNGPELAATWANLRIQAGASTVTLALDERARTVRERLCVSLYPLAEWLAANWWFLNYEVESPLKHDDAGFRRRHSLAANREGYAYPDLHVFPQGSLTRLVWHGGSIPWAKTRLLDAGELLIDSAEFREACGDFVDCVVARLACLGIEDTLLQQDWHAVRAAEPRRQIFAVPQRAWAGIPTRSTTRSANKYTCLRPSSATRLRRPSPR